MFKNIVFGLMCCSAMSVLADGVETLDELVRQALAADPELCALEAGGEAARAAAKQAALRPNPEFSADAGFKRADAEEGAESGYAFGVGLAQTFERSGKREARVAVAEADVTFAVEALAQRRRELEARVRGLAHAYRIDAADAQAAGEVSRRSRALIDMLKQRPAAGVAIFLELRMIEASLIEFQAAAREFAGQRDDARIALNTLLNRDPDSPLNLPAEIEMPAALAQAEALAKLEDHPRLGMLRAELARRNGEAREASLAARPDVSIGPFVSQEDAGEQELVAGLSFSMELPLRNRNQGAIAAAAARGRQAGAEFDAGQRALLGDLAQALRANARALAQLEAVSAASVEDMHAAADLAERQYRLGAIGVQLFLDMQREYLNVQRRRHEALRNAWSSTLDIFQATGIAPEEQP